MLKQNLPTYKHDFLTYDQWCTKESPHYIFHYFGNSEADKDISSIIYCQEKAYKRILDFLSIESSGKKIEYYLYPNKEVKTALMGDDWYAQSIIDEFRVHILYTKDIKPLGEHEDTHLLSLPWGIPIGLFQEGLAEFMVGHAWDGKSHGYYAREGYLNNMYLPLSEYFDHQAWLDTDDTKPLYYYSLAGAFTAYLINKFGKDKFEEVYRSLKRGVTKNENIEKFEKVYESLVKIEEEFKESLQV
ncbi:MAG: hypothetical protein WC666_01735 [Candidatus Paceibacterota bacterium]|jgi:hypothetical protein